MRILVSGCDESRFNYENAVRQAGGEPCSYYCPPLDDSCDGLLLCGGNDVNPDLYGQPNIASRDIDFRRDEAELALARLYLEAGKPILGICRGMQMLNVVLGGDMIQDIGPHQLPFHGPWQGPDYKVHLVQAWEGSALRQIYGEVFPVNSCHHQALGHLGVGLKVAAVSECGIIEAVEHSSLPVRGVQWHPERMCYTNRRPDTVDGAPLFQWLISAARA